MGETSEWDEDARGRGGGEAVEGVWQLAFYNILNKYCFIYKGNVVI